jgi:hypothetical protein
LILLVARKVVMTMTASGRSTTGATTQDYYGGLGPAIVDVCWSLFGLGTVLLALRIYTFFAIVKNKGGWAVFWACVAWVSLDCDLPFAVEASLN